MTICEESGRGKKERNKGEKDRVKERKGTEQTRQGNIMEQNVYVNSEI